MKEDKLKKYKRVETSQEEELRERYEIWREVPLTEAQFCIILRPQSYDTSVLFYKSKEDAEWALKNSWFSYKEAIIARLLETKLEIIDEANQK